MECQVIFKNFCEGFTKVSQKFHKKSLKVSTWLKVKWLKYESSIWFNLSKSKIQFWRLLQKIEGLFKAKRDIVTEVPSCGWRVFAGIIRLHPRRRLLFFSSLAALERLSRKSQEVIAVRTKSEPQSKTAPSFSPMARNPPIMDSESAGGRPPADWMAHGIIKTLR